MARTLTADVRLLDLPQVRRFSASVTALLGALGGCDGAMAGAQARRVITR